MVWDLVNLEIDTLHSPDNWNKLKVFFQIQLPNFKAWWPKFFPWEVNVSENLLPLVLIMLAPGAHGAEPSIQGLCVYCGHVWVLLPFLSPLQVAFSKRIWTFLCHHHHHHHHQYFTLFFLFYFLLKFNWHMIWCYCQVYNVFGLILKYNSKMISRISLVNTYSTQS